VFLLLSILSSVLSAAADRNGGKALALLTSNFAGSPPEIQKKVLREIGVLRVRESVPFLGETALNEGLDNDVRREALKAILATDTGRYRGVLAPLKADSIEASAVTAAFLELGHPEFLEVFVRRASAGNLSARDVRVAVVAALDLWEGDERAGFRFRSWRGKPASAQLIEIASQSVGLRKSKAVAALGWVRDRASTRFLIRLLDGEDPALTALSIDGLSNPGPDASPALGRFLLKTRSPEAADRALRALERSNSPAAKRAVEAYRSKQRKGGG
jgi:HEAT repeat protein